MAFYGSFATKGLSATTLRGVGVVCFALNAGLASASAEIEAVLARDAFAHGAPPASSRCYDRVIDEIMAKDAAADRAWESLRTPAAISSYREILRTRFAAAIGGFPEKTPLNVRCLGKVPRDGYVIEKLLFESRPKHFVTALLFVPDNPKCAAPYPGVVVTCGHNPNGKNTTCNQRAAVVLAKHGLVALIFDPIDQGERQQLAGSETWSVHGHVNVGLRAHLVGWGAAQFRLWDGMRALDVLSARPEVDASRVGVTGMSGGGTMSSYLNAMDLRYHAASPMGFITTISALADRCGPQDSEQIVFGQLDFGLNHLALLLMNGRSAVCPGYSYGDFFPYFGSVQTQTKAEAFFVREGRPDEIGVITCSGPHDWYESEKQALARWMRFKLAGDRAAWKTADFAALRRLDVGFDYSTVDCGLAMTPDTNVLGGRGVMSLPGARSVYDLVCERLTELEKGRSAPTPEKIRATCGLSADCSAVTVRCDEKDLDGVRALTAILERPDEMDFRVCAFVPKSAQGTPVLVADPGWKPSELAVRVQEFLDEGRAVAVATVRAFANVEPGYSRSTYWSRKSPEQEIAAFYAWLGKNLVTLRAEDLLAAAAWFKSVVAASMELVAEGRSAVAAAHAYYFGKDRFTTLKMTDVPRSWTEIVRHPESGEPPFSDLVFGALATYDWTDLLDRGAGK